MRIWLQKAYLGVAWLLASGVVIQFLLVGLALFAGYSFGPHIKFGFFFLGVAPIVLLILAFLAGLPRRIIGLSALILVLMIVQVSLPGLRSMLPIVAALHPINALLVLWLSARLAQQAHTYAHTATQRKMTGFAHADQAD